MTEAEGAPVSSSSPVREGLKRLASESIVYGLGQAGGRAVQLLLVPVLTRVLDPAAYGVSELVVGYSQTLILVLVLGMDSALARFFYQEPDRDAKTRMVSTSFFFRIALGFGIAAVIAAFAAPIADRMIGGGAYRKYVRIGAATMPFTLLVMFGNDVLRVTFQPWKYVALNLVQTVLGAGLALWFVVRMNLGVAGVLYGRWFGDALAAVVGLALIRLALRPTFHAETLRRMLAYGAPMLPAIIAFGVMTGFDRYMLQRTRSLEELAVYAVAMKFFTVLIFTASAFQLAYGPFAYARAGAPEAPRLFSRALSLYVTIGSAGALLVGLFAPEALAVLAPRSYAAAALPAMLLAFAAVAFGAYTVSGIGIGLALKTPWAGACAGGAALITIVAHLVLTPRYGPVGAALATWAGYVTAAVLSYIAAQRFYPLPYRGARLFALFLLATATCAVAHRVVPAGAVGVGIKLVVVIAFTALAARFGGAWIPPVRRDAAGS